MIDCGGWSEVVVDGVPFYSRDHWVIEAEDIDYNSWTLYYKTVFVDEGSLEDLMENVDEGYYEGTILLNCVKLVAG